MSNGANIISAKRRNQARKHAERVTVCVCGKACKGNGGWSSHKKACPEWKQAIEARKEQQP